MTAVGVTEDDPKHKKLEKNTRNVNSTVPIDRGWAWMTVLGSFGIHALIFGSCKSLGVLILEIKDRFGDVSATEMFLVQGINVTLMFGLGFVASMLSDRYSTRSVVFVGGLLSSVGFILTAFIDRFWLIYFTYSVICGVGFGLSYTPCVVFSLSHFKKRKSLANGLALAGSGVGSFILPNFIRWSLKVYGLFGCCLLLGALMLNVCVCALLFRPHSNYKRRGLRGFQPVVNDDISADELEMTVSGYDSDSSRSTPVCDISGADVIDEDKFCGGSDKRAQQMTDKSAKEVYLKGNASLLNRKDGRKPSTSTLAALAASTSDLRQWKSSTSSMGRENLDWSLLSHPVAVLYIMWSFCVNYGYPNVIFMLPDHVEDIDQDRDTAAFIVSIIGISDITGRLFVGWFADRDLVEKRYLFVGCSVASGILSLLVPPNMISHADMVMYSVLYGFFFGGYMALVAVVLAEALGQEKLHSSYNFAMIGMTLTLIPGSLICGQIRDITDSWDAAFTFAGVMAVTASLFPLLQPCILRLLQNKDGDLENDDTSNRKTN